MVVSCKIMIDIHKYDYINIFANRKFKSYAIQMFPTLKILKTSKFLSELTYKRKIVKYERD